VDPLPAIPDDVNPTTYLGVLARRDLFLPGGEMAMKMASNPTVLQVGDTVFAHAGIDMSTVTCTCCLSQIQAHCLARLP